MVGGGGGFVDQGPALSSGQMGGSGVVVQMNDIWAVEGVGAGAEAAKVHCRRRGLAMERCVLCPSARGRPRRQWRQNRWCGVWRWQCAGASGCGSQRDGGLLLGGSSHSATSPQQPCRGSYPLSSLRRPPGPLPPHTLTYARPRLAWGGVTDMRSRAPQSVLNLFDHSHSRKEPG